MFASLLFGACCILCLLFWTDVFPLPVCFRVAFDWCVTIGDLRGIFEMFGVHKMRLFFEAVCFLLFF